MAQDPKNELPFEDPFENRVIQDPFEDQHFTSTNSNFGGNPIGNPGGASWSESLPDSTAVLVLGILSIIASFCYGIVGLILGIIALAIAGKPERRYRESPNRYSQSSYGNLKAGKICAIIGVCISGVIILVMIVAFASIARW